MKKISRISLALMALTIGLTQQCVADGMAKDVVDFFEPVEVDTQGGEASAGGIRAVDRLGKVRVEARPIGKVSQGIVVCQMLDPSFRPAFFRDVLGHHQQILSLPIRASNNQPLAVDCPDAIAWGFDFIAFQGTAVLDRD